jgi:hypothetical protein
MSRTSCSTLTWYEEWFFYFEKMWGRTLTCWIDAEDKEDGYGICAKTLQRVLDNKLAQVECCRASWPEFAFYNEDKKMSSEEMNEKYEGLRPVFWDMTNIQIPKPSDAQMQRLTYSTYYSQNCFKGGIGLQLCGWIRVHDLWTGCVSDTSYQSKSGIFEVQQKFSEKDESNKSIPFTNVFDKGYRNRLVAWQAGGQLTLQPTFAKSDRKFRREDTLSSAVVAADRSGNERAVRLSKMSAYLNDGMENNQSIERIHLAWIDWGFQVNFMFNAVL